MRKSLSLMLSATFALGAVVSSYAAPLQKRGRAIPQELFAEVAPVAPSVKLLQPFSEESAQQMQGLFQVQSKIQAQRARAVKSATAAQRALSSNIDLRAWSCKSPYGLYKLMSDGTTERVLANYYTYSSGYYTGDKYYAVRYTTSLSNAWRDTYEYNSDTDTWKKTLDTKSPVYELISYDVAEDPTTGTVYGYYLNDDKNGWVWGTADYVNCTRTKIADADNTLVMSLGCDNNGQFYCITEDGKFHKVDKATGERTEIGDTGLAYKSFCSGVYNYRNDTFLTTYYDTNESGLAEINITTGEATILYKFATSVQFNCMFINKPAAEDKAPAEPEEFKVECIEGSMDVKVTLQMPSTLFDGTPATGQSFSYKVLSDGVELLTGSAEAGATVTRTVTMSATGNTDFVAYAYNETGNSPQVKASTFVGKGTPNAPTNVSVSWADEKATVTWDAVTESSDGGYLNPADVTYNITRVEKSGSTVVATGYASNTFTESYPTPESYQTLSYKVQAVYAEKTSSEVASNSIGVGAFTVPMSMDFTSADNFGYHTVIDANGDGKTWRLNSSCAQYNYSSRADADDWLISPNIKLEAGKAYELNATISGNGYPEKLAICYGQGSTVDAMKNVLEEVDIPSTVSKKNGDYMTVSEVIIPEETGLYNIGFHAMSPADKFYIWIKDYKITEMDPSVPGVVDDASVTPYNNGELRAKISFKAPTKNVVGATLSSKVNVEVKRGDELVTYVTGNPGTVYSFEDTVEEAGTYTYTFHTSSAAGEIGALQSLTVYIGPLVPSYPDNLRGYESASEPGNIILTWDAVTTAEDGTPLDPSSITYDIYSTGYDIDGNFGLDKKLNTEPVTGTSFVVEYGEQDYQEFMQFVVQPKQGTAEGKLYLTEAIAVGEPYELPSVISNKDDLETYILAATTTNYANCGVTTKGFWLDAYDDDNGCFSAFAPYLGGTATFLTGKYKLDVERPYVSFYAYKYTDDDTNNYEVSVVKEGVTYKVATFTNDGVGAKGEWHKFKADLSAYKDEVVQISITAINNCNAGYMIFDVLTIADEIDDDLSIKMSAPATVDTNESFYLTITVRNEGAQRSATSSIDILRNGQFYTTAEIGPLDPDQSETLNIPQVLGPDEDSATFQASISYEADLNPYNNDSKVVTVTRNKSTLLVVDNLTGEVTDEGVALTWDAVDTGDKTPHVFTEDFESCEPWAQSIDYWTFVDRDDAVVGRFGGVAISIIASDDSKASYFVLDATSDEILAADYPTSFTAHSGHQYLSAMYVADEDVAADDWLISTELPGIAQTISFYAKSYNPTYPETFEVLYSVTDSEIASFQRVDGGYKENISNEWTEYSFDLPEGTKFFAIRHVSVDAHAFFVDDITYTRFGGLPYNILGYNVYRDGEKLNDELVTTNNFVDPLFDNQTHTYAVTAVYDRGESELSNSVTVQTSSVDMIAAKQVTVGVQDRQIVVNGAEDLMVTMNGVDGRTLYNAVGNARVAVNSGVYLVTVNKRTYKVVVR